MRCAKCKHSWFQDAQPAEIKEEAEESAKAPSADAATAPPKPEPEARPPAPEPDDAETKAPTAPPAAEVEQSAGQDESEEPAENADAEATPEPGCGPAEEDVASETLEESFEGAHDPLAGAEEDEPYYDDADDAFGEDEYGEDASSFDYRPPFTRRRNSLKMWTIAAGVFAVLATGTVVAANFYGLPDWVPIQRPEFGIGKSDLELDFPASNQRKEVLESGEEIFQIRGSINNVGQESVAVPSLLIVFRDAREKNVYSWVVVPSKRELAPGESLNVTEAITDIPPTAQAAEIGWSPS